ncbi:MAG: DUF2264 domain-containing protein [Terracidiphilus sp.]|nr:DUF2264 domain-containing protein [Terracidiphilus sp.]
MAAAAAALADRAKAAPTTKASSPSDTHKLWIGYVKKTAGPLLTALSERQLKKVFPIECKPGQEESRRKCTYLEALGRTLCGLGPWLESGDESADRNHYRELARESLRASVDPNSLDLVPFGSVPQTLVDAAFLGLGILRSPKELNAVLPSDTRQWLIDGLKKTRTIKPPESNWLLFSAVVEATLAELGSDWEAGPVEHALEKHKSWYVGDGIYGDGPDYHADFYDSFVIHPFMRGVLDSRAGLVGVGPELRELEPARATRFASIQERAIGRDGTWPVQGRSITYRCGAFHLLADVALRHQLPQGVAPAQVRCALTAAIEASLGARGTYDANGWLTIGLAGHQPQLGEFYISTGSLYLCLEAFLPLGLKLNDPFWKDPDTAWTAKHVWSGGDLPADHALEGFKG